MHEMAKVNKAKGINENMKAAIDLQRRERVIFDRVPLVTTVLQQSHYAPLVHLATIEMVTSALTV